MPDKKGQTMAYKYGRRPPKNAPALRLGTFLRRGADGAPAHPAEEDYLAGLSNWQMLGNDRVGDCNAVTWANMRRLSSTFGQLMLASTAMTAGAKPHP